MKKSVQRRLMLEAIKEAKRSKNSRPTDPKVGAILTNSKGKILYRAHRGKSVKDGHAEFHVFKECDNLKKIKGSSLFVTLEPCTRRGRGKIPCAVRVAESGIKEIYIGTLDPNPHITGRGEMYLQCQGIKIHRFPWEMLKKLQDLNANFFTKYHNLQIPSVSPYAGGGARGDFRPALAGQREGILQQSMDLISGTSGDLMIFAGDLSWLKELQIPLVLAKFKGRRIRVLCDKVSQRDSRFFSAVEVARRLGADVGLVNDDVKIRGTLVGAGTKSAAMMCVEKHPASHAILFQAPHEDGLIGSMSVVFQSFWKKAVKKKGFRPVIEKIKPEVLCNILKDHVPQYKHADVTLHEENIRRIKPLAQSLERFKLSRLHLVAEFLQKARTQIALINGSPWPVFPPVIEEVRTGQKVVIDGGHRIYANLERNVTKMPVILVKNVKQPLPCQPLQSWGLVKLRSDKLPATQKYVGFKRHFFRNIKAAVSHLV